MLVLSRQRDEVIEIGESDTRMVGVKEHELAAIEEMSVDSPSLQGLLARLRATRSGPIEITVVDIRGDKVRMGIEAPREIPVHRKEVAEDIRREKCAA